MNGTPLFYTTPMPDEIFYPYFAVLGLMVLVAVALVSWMLWELAGSNRIRIAAITVAGLGVVSLVTYNTIDFSPSRMEEKQAKFPVRLTMNVDPETITLPGGQVADEAVIRYTISDINNIGHGELIGNYYAVSKDRLWTKEFRMGETSKWRDIGSVAIRTPSWFATAGDYTIMSSPGDFYVVNTITGEAVPLARYPSY